MRFEIAGDRHWMSNLRFPVGRERSHIHRLHWKSIYQFTRHFFRSAAQIPLHKMYTFVYRTFIKFILFCRGQAPDVCKYLLGFLFLTA